MYFSGIERIFGQIIRGIKLKNIIQKMRLKVYF